MNFEEILSDFGAQIGNGLPLKTVQPGLVTLDVDGTVLLFKHHENPDLIDIRAIVAPPLPEDRRERFYRVMLQANHHYAGTSGSTLAIHPKTNEIVLRHVIAVFFEVDGQVLLDIVAPFVTTLGLWRRLIGEFRVADLSDTEPADDFNRFVRNGYLRV